MTTMLSVGSENQLLIARFLAAREETDAIFREVLPEAMFDRPIPERHRIVFYIGHLEAFDWNLLGASGEAASSHAEFDRLFAFGIDPVGGNLPTDLPQDWPQLEIVGEYRDRVREELDEVIACASPQLLTHLLNVAIEHRLMHAETLAYILHQMPFDRKRKRAARSLPRNSAFVPGDSVRIPKGEAVLGLRRDSPVFGWDNEFNEHTVRVPEFTIDRFKVTNGAFLRFLEDGGYSKSALWTVNDWVWRTANKISHPAFWVRRGDAWSYRSMFDELPLPLDWPVYVSHAEASAYARWAGKLLPTEAQWQLAASGNSGRVAAGAWDPLPVNHRDASVSVFGVTGMIGNGWEWMSTEFAPFPGFRPFACYPGYSEPFFDGWHYVLKGGSVRTAPCMLRPSFRNWFQPHYQYVYSGFRCVRREPQ
jgi:gamma-glutamyl hercynylcysteine S-oxide synthase